MTHEWLSVKDIADELRVTPVTVRKMLERNEINTFRIGTVLRIHRHDFNRLVKKLSDPYKQVPKQ